MTSDPPTVLMPLLAQPVVAQDLGIEVVRLERRVMDLVGRTLGEEEHVVIDFLFPSVQAVEDGAVDVLGVVHDLFSPNA